MRSSLTWRWLVDYTRRPFNVVLLIAVPVIFVSLTAGVLSDFSDILGGQAALGDIEAATAGWSAAAIAGVSSFFQVSTARSADRRLARAGAGSWRIVTSRLLSALALATIATAGSIAALRTRSELAFDVDVVTATLLSAIVYTAIGVTVGAIVHSELNGSLIVVFIWFFDVFLGPTMGGTGVFVRFFPLHFPTFVAVGIDSGHAGLLGDVAVSGIIAATLLVGAAITLTLTTRPSAPGIRLPATGRRFTVGLRLAIAQISRTRLLWVLVIVLPAAFITTSIAITPSTPTPIELAENGRVITMLSMAEVHGAVMVPITIGFIASLIGLFVILDAAPGDRRLSLTPFRPVEILTIRFATIGAAALIATAGSIATTAVSFDAERWTAFVLANILVAWTYAMIGVIVAPLFGRLGGLYFLLLLPFIDIGIAQNAMFDAAPPPWARWLPAHGAVRVLMDAAFTPSFDAAPSLALALGWIVALTGTAFMTFRHAMRV